MSFLKTTANGKSIYSKLYDVASNPSAIQTIYKTAKCDGSETALGLTNTKLYAGRTYYVKVQFRTRGDGSSTASKCSSIGFIMHWDNRKSVRSYIHYSETAYNEIGKVVSWTYSFTVDSDIQPDGTYIYFIIDNQWARGYDNQTIDLYYLKYYDSLGNVYNEWGTFTPLLRVNNLYLPLSTTSQSGAIKVINGGNVVGYIINSTATEQIVIQFAIEYYRTQKNYSTCSDYEELGCIYGIDNVGVRVYRILSGASDLQPASPTVTLNFINGSGLTYAGRCSEIDSYYFCYIPAQSLTFTNVTELPSIKDLPLKDRGYSRDTQYFDSPDRMCPTQRFLVYNLGVTVTRAGATESTATISVSQDFAFNCEEGDYIFDFEKNPITKSFTHA